MTCTKAPKKQAIFRIFSPISGIFRGYCKTLSTKTRIDIEKQEWNILVPIIYYYLQTAES